MSVVFSVSDDLLLAAFDSPCIVGIGHLMLDKNMVYTETYTACKIATLEGAQFEKLVTQENLWQLLSIHLTTVVNILFSVP